MISPIARSMMLMTPEDARAEASLGITSGETNESYHASMGLSNSGLKQFAKTPAHYQAYTQRDDDETASQRLGTLAHMRILEEDRFFKTVVKNDLNRNTNEFKALRTQVEAAGGYICKTQEYDDVCRMADNIFKQPTVKQLFQGGKAEQSVRWKDPETGLLLKCRPDYLRPDGVIVDVKTFADLSQDSLERQIFKMRYHWQSRFYLNGVNHVLGLPENTMFAHLFIDTEAFVGRVVILDDPSLSKAEEEIRPLINRFAECAKTGDWPGYPDEILTVSLPAYAWRGV